MQQTIFMGTARGGGGQIPFGPAGVLGAGNLSTYALPHLGVKMGTCDAI